MLKLHRGAQGCKTYSLEMGRGAVHVLYWREGLQACWLFSRQTTWCCSHRPLLCLQSNMEATLHTLESVTCDMFG